MTTNEAAETKSWGAYLQVLLEQHGRRKHAEDDKGGDHGHDGRDNLGGGLDARHAGEQAEHGEKVGHAARKDEGDEEPHNEPNPGQIHLNEGAERDEVKKKEKKTKTRT